MSDDNSHNPKGNGQAPLQTAGEPAVAFDPTRVPEALRERPQWVAWRYEPRGGKPAKVPCDPRTGERASSTDRSNWVSFDEAVDGWQKGDRYAGIGFVFSASDLFCGIDLDDCIDERGVVAPDAQAIIDALNSYTEISPSGRGVKIFIRGRKPEGARSRSTAVQGFKEIEVYDRDRYFTVTGQHLAGTPTAVEDAQEALDRLCARLWPMKQPSPATGQVTTGFDGDDEQLLRMACSAKNGDLFKRLWAGDTSMHGGDDSAADLAFCNFLAFWTGGDPVRMDRLFRRSGLFRPKWDEPRGAHTYGELTIAKAIAGRASTYMPDRPHLNGEAMMQDVMPCPLPMPGEIDPSSGKLVLSTRRTLPTAQAYVKEFHTHPDRPTLVSYGGVFLSWSNNRYVETDDAGIRHRLQPWLHDALEIRSTSRGDFLKPFPGNSASVNAALESIRAHTYLSSRAESPSWIGGSADRPPPLELLPCRSGNVHIPSGALLPPTPNLFVTNALDFDFDADAPPPERFLGFLDQLFADDDEAISLLQQWFGYCLTCDTRQQRMLLIVGPRRSGKGTLARVLTHLVGAGNVVGPTTSSLASQFGLQPLIGKSLAIVSDARFKGDRTSVLTERLLCISGEDRLTIDRKHIGSVSMKLPTRMMFLSNELPRIADASNALSGRFVILTLTKSFYGTEDLGLLEDLLKELPGILLWAMDGWKRLNADGRFVMPESSRDAVRELEDLGSPVGAFVRDWCDTGVGRRADLDQVYAAWKEWCDSEGRSKPGTRQSFGRDLRAAVPGMRRKRGTGNVPFYEGIAVKETLS